MKVMITAFLCLPIVHRHARMTDHEYNQNLQKLRDAASKRELTQRQLAALTGHGYAYVRRLMCGAARSETWLNEIMTKLGL